MIHSREELQLAHRVVIKAGTSVISTPDGFPSLTRIAQIVENVSYYVFIKSMNKALNKHLITDCVL